MLRLSFVLGLVAFSLLTSEQVLIAADTLRISLEDCIEIALHKSPTALKVQYDSTEAAGIWKSSRADRYPQLRLITDIPTHRESNDYDIAYDPDTDQDEFLRSGSGETRWQGQVLLEQELPWGATFDVSTRLYKSDWYNDRISSGRDTTEFSWRRRASLVQPLLAGNPVGRSRAISRISWENSLYDHELSLRNIKYDATEAFYNLVSAYGNLRIAEQDLERGKSAESLAIRKYKAGLIPEVELLQIQLDLSRRESSHSQSIMSLESSMDRLRQRLGLPLEIPILPIWEIEFSEGLFKPEFESSGKRIEQFQESNRIRRLELENKSSRISELIDASVQLYYEVDTRQPEFERLDKPGDQNFGIIMRFEIPIFGFGSTSGRLQQLAAQLKRAKLNQSIKEVELRVELRSALRRLKQSVDRILISEATVKLSERSYAISLERFDGGLIDSRELLDSQVDLTLSRREALEAQIEYQLAIAQLERIKPLDFRQE